MRISDLINELHAVIEQHGDQLVYSVKPGDSLEGTLRSPGFCIVYRQDEMTGKLAPPSTKTHDCSDKILLIGAL